MGLKKGEHNESLFSFIFFLLFKILFEKILIFYQKATNYAKTFVYINELLNLSE
jgi:hypothetical protein